MGERKKRILFVRTAPYKINWKTYNIQGLGLAKAMCKKGYDFDYLYFDSQGEKISTFKKIGDNEIRIISKKGYRWFRTGICPSLLKENLESYDLIIVCEYNQIMSYLLSRKYANVVLYSGPYYNLFMIPFTSVFYDILFTKKINTNIKLKLVKSVLAKEYLESKGYTDVVNIGVGLDIDVFESNATINEEAKAVIEFMKRFSCILYVGALSKRKNFGFTLNMFEKLRVYLPDVHMVIVGRGNKSYIDKCKSNINKDTLNNIMFIEKLDNSQLKNVYPLAKAFVLPSLIEIFGMVLLEAMYLGAPVISSRNGGSLTLIKDGVNGYIKDSFDIDEWANTANDLICNEGLRNRIILEAQKTIRDSYTWDAIAEKIETLTNG